MSFAQGRQPKLHLIRDQPPPPEQKGEVGVLAAMRRNGRNSWLRVGVATVEPGHAGQMMLCVHLGALPDDRELYIPLGDVMALCGGPFLSERDVGHA